MRTTIITNPSTGSDPLGSGNISSPSSNSFAVLLEDDEAAQESNGEEQEEQADIEESLTEASLLESINQGNANATESVFQAIVKAQILRKKERRRAFKQVAAGQSDRFNAEEAEDRRALRPFESSDELDSEDSDEDDYDDFSDDDYDDYFDDDESYTYHKARTSRPLPDLRFEQSYRKAIAGANGVWWKIAYITVRDQVLFTLFQGFLWQLTLVGIRSWRMTMANNGGQWGQTFVGRLSRWWSRVNNNKI
ncbi:uncharacterized protein SAPINGB_P001166 [Magnusiomyces paraingens]|uniref:DUF1770 domain-containing protein n=1 Tax=Magnusiomyces paraingens TaxID=2606893 RepID=A0A5E8BAM0_9ASCO|nr:uncharacterized protein SAPINGB_P001166 [Saprochaete ingens]VVT46343.1 unnamed protein product [Saprochaete ingens]